MIDSATFRTAVSQQLLARLGQVPSLTAFVGLDGFVDEILHVVDKRTDSTTYTRVPTIASYAERLAAAAGKSTNIELVNVLTKLGGNGPIMANALASFGMQVTYLGSLGYPAIHPVFETFQKRAKVHSICGPGLTDALEFDDGKLMVGKHYTLKEVTWENILRRFGLGPFQENFGTANLVGFVNWTMLPFMSDIWETVQSDVCPRLKGPRRWLFVDLADPEKRLPQDIRRALGLITKFQEHFDVILGLNEKEAHEVGHVLGFECSGDAPESLAELSMAIHRAVPVNTLVVHPVSYALAVSAGEVSVVKGLVCSKPKITTGAGDHFNSGFCLGKLLGFDNAASVLCGVTASGHYVRTAQSSSVADLAKTMEQWPQS